MHVHDRFKPSRMIRGIWPTMGLPLPSDIPTADEGIDNAVAGSMVFLELACAEFKCHMNIHGEQLPVQVVRWQRALRMQRALLAPLLMQPKANRDRTHAFGTVGDAL